MKAVARLWQWLGSRQTLRGLALASVIANVVIVVTGGAVRLTGSGLGCPTWPSCTDGSLTPTKAYSFHGIIEFTNRQLTFVLSVVVLATLASSLLAAQQRRLAIALALSIPAQAVLGGVTVLTHLNPWAVAAHFLLSMAIIAVAFALFWRVQHAQPLNPGQLSRSVLAPNLIGPSARAVAPLRRCARGLAVITVAVLAIGTVVTGSGPHAGTTAADGDATSHRIQLSPSSVSQLHADTVMLLIGLTIGFVVLVRAAGGSSRQQRAAKTLLGVELAQGLIGFVQYFSGVPALLVAFHMLGACLVWLAALRVLALTAAATHPRAPIGEPVREDSPTLAG